MDLTNLSFADKTGIITGAAQGIGYSIARQFVALGGKAILVDINEKKTCEVVAELGNAVGYTVDMSKPEEAAEGFKKIIDEQGRIDVLVNVAGIVNTARFADLTLDEWERVFEINLTSVFTTSQVVFRHMAERGGGRIVNIASVAAKVGGGLLGTSAYAASKAGMISLTKSIAKDGSAKNIYCNSVCPAFIRTPILKDMTPEQEEKVTASISLHRAGTADELASVAVFLASDAASFVQGENINCDGGLLMDG